MKNRVLASLFVIGLILLGSTGSCTSSSVTKFEPSYWPTQNWQNSLPEDQGMDSAQLMRMFGYIEENDINLHSLLIVRNGYLVTEAYWNPYGPKDQHTVESITKSVIGSLIGISIDQGMLKNTDQELLDFFPERIIQNLDNKKKSIALHNLLSMTPGLDCEDSKSLDGVIQSNDWVQSFLDLPMSSKPGSKWIYCSGASHLLSAILEGTTGMTARTFANRNLFAPLGIPQVSEEDWNSDPQGITNGIAGLYLTPRDLAKYGYLYLNSGKWDGRQVISSNWVTASTHEQAYIGKDAYVGGLDRRFGYFWSIFPDQHYFGYLGRGGQELFVLPNVNMVVIFTGALEVGNEGMLLPILNDYIVPSVRSKSAIPSNPDAYASLESLIRAVAESIKPLPIQPKTAWDVTGKTYKLEQNLLGWSEMTFFFDPNLEEARLKMPDTPDLKIGLDNRFRLTETPSSRPIGLRGYWSESNTFYLDYIIFGDFIRNEALISFEGDGITITISDRNWNSPPIVIYGSVQD